MARLPFLLTLLLIFSLTAAFLIQQKSAINWPFNVCGPGPWKMTALTLSAQPSRNVDVLITAVQLYLHRPAQ